MKNLHTKARLYAAAVLLPAMLVGVNVCAQEVSLEPPTSAMYGDVIFSQDFGEYDGSSTENTQYGSPTSFEKIGGMGQVGANYEYDAEPEGSGQYAITTGLNNVVAGSVSMDFLRKFKDHTGLTEDAAWDITVPYSPIDKPHQGTGRMLYVDVNGNPCTIYKQQVTQMCDASSYEFSAWVASVHNERNNADFRLEIWSDDPDKENDCEGGREAAVGEALEGGAKLLAAYRKKVEDDEFGKWINLKLYFELKEQSYCYVILRTYSLEESGNDLVVDDISIRPYAPFDLDVALADNATTTACENGLVTIFSELKDVPEYVKISDYAFFFEGKSKETGDWVRLGSEVPMQLQSAKELLELTLPVSEYTLYSYFRLAVAATPSGFGGECVTYRQQEEEAVPVTDAPQFVLLGDDVCVPEGGEAERMARFVIWHTNQTGNNNWRVKVRTKDGRVMTLQPCPAGDTACADAGYTLVE